MLRFSPRALLAGALLLWSPSPAGAAVPFAHHGHVPSRAPVVDIAATPSGGGYWTLDADGGVFTHGDAGFSGSVPLLRNQGLAIGRVPVADLAPRRRGGYWVLDHDGGVFPFGGAAFLGSVPLLRRSGARIGHAAAVDLEPTGSGRGYWVLDRDGGIFTFGDAPFLGSVPGLRAAGQRIGRSPAVALASTSRGDGYWVLDAEGGVFTFGTAGFHGSLPRLGIDGLAVDLAMAPDGAGYWIVDSHGRVHGFGSARDLGDAVGFTSAPATGITAHPSGGGYWVVFADGTVVSVSPSGTWPPDGQRAAPDLIARDVFDRLNAERAARGAPVLRWDPALAERAGAWVRAMSAGTIAHAPPGWYSGAGLSTGENVFYGSGPSSRDVNVGFMESTVHRDIRMYEGASAGAVAVVCSGARLWAVEVVGGTVDPYSPGWQAPSPIVRGDPGLRCG